MSVKIRKRKSTWWIFVNHNGQRKAKQVGTRAAAEEVKRELEARLALGDVGCLQSKTASAVQTFGDYADQWLIRYAKIECKSSTVRSYEQLLRVHIKPRFGAKRITDITRDDVKNFLAEMSSATRSVNGALVPKFARNSLRLIMTTLRTILFAAVEDEIIEKNPASKVGKFVKTERPPHKARAMTKRETEQFLSAVEDVWPDWSAFFTHCSPRRIM